MKLREQNVPRRFIKYLFFTQSEDFDPLVAFGEILPFLNVVARVNNPQRMQFSEALLEILKEDHVSVLLHFDCI